MNLVDEEQNLGKDVGALPGVDRGLVEGPGLLEDGGLLQVGVGVAPARAPRFLVILLIALHSHFRR